MNDYIRISNLPFISTSLEKFVYNLLATPEKSKLKYIVTANPEIVMETRKNPSYKNAVMQADYIVPDGIGILLAAKLKGTPIKSRIAGFDLMTKMLEYANEKKASCYFLGAKEEVNEKAVANIKKLYPSLSVAGRHHGYFSSDDLEIVDKVIKSKADFVFVALGYPKQEEWIARYKNQFSKGVFMGVGGSLDVFSGQTKRAPEIWIKLKLEWLYRFLKQPSRWRRIIPLLQFSILALFKKL